MSGSYNRCPKESHVESAIIAGILDEVRSWYPRIQVSWVVDLCHFYRTQEAKKFRPAERGTLTSLPIRYSAWVPQDCGQIAQWTRVTWLAYVASGDDLWGIPQTTLLLYLCFRRDGSLLATFSLKPSYCFNLPKHQLFLIYIVSISMSIPNIFPWDLHASWYEYHAHRKSH
jgi:hypothetical protein